MATKDVLDELVQEGTERDSAFPSMVDAAYARRRDLRETSDEIESTGVDEESDQLP